MRFSPLAMVAVPCTVLVGCCFKNPTLPRERQRIEQPMSL